MATIEKIIEWSQGNPGALTFLMSLNDYESIPNRNMIFGKLERATAIRGTSLYVLWADLCDKDLDRVSVLCADCPIDILEDACSRQDYSGKEIVKTYFEEMNKTKTISKLEKALNLRWKSSGKRNNVFFVVLHPETWENLLKELSETSGMLGVNHYPELKYKGLNFYRSLDCKVDEFQIG